MLPSQSDSPRFTLESRVEFHPLSRQIDGDEAVVGRPETQTFLALPVEALEVIDLLATGNTIGQTQKVYHERHGETPDIVGFLEIFDAKGLLVSPGLGDRVGGARPKQVEFHFRWIPSGMAQALFSAPALAFAALLISGAAMAMGIEPALRPSWRWLFFEQDFTVIGMLMLLAGIGVTCMHEMGHLLAARARGVQCRLGIGHRLWVLVAETDMTGVWSLPRRKRFLPILAGPLIDAVSASAVLLVLFAQTRGLVELSSMTLRILQALTLVYILNISWQFYFFVRTDLYFVYAAAFGCKDLMKDTQKFLSNQFARLLGRPARTDQSHLPQGEMRAIRVYSFFWLLGRAIAFSVLFLVTLPLMWTYLNEMGPRLFSSGKVNSLEFLDALVFVVVGVGFTAIGFGMWFRSLYLAWR